MLKFFKKKSCKDTVIEPVNEEIENDLQDYFISELSKEKFIKENKRSVVSDHLMHKINIFKTENKLSKEEKQELGLNTRLSITKELVDVLTLEAIQNVDNPKDIIERVYYKAVFKKNRDEQINKMKNMSITHFKLMNCKDERTCKWCKSTANKKFSVNEDINTLIESNCKSSYCRCSIEPIIKI
jgi:hypothetical protein